MSVKHFMVDETMPVKDVDTFTGKDAGEGPMMIHIDSHISEFRPIELHHKVNGANSGPSFAILMVKPHTLLGKEYALGQVSLEMLTKALFECGYTISKNKTDGSK